MAQRKALNSKHLGSLISTRSPGAKATAEMRQWAVYSTCPQYPGKLVQRLPDGTEVVGTFQNGAFVPE